MSPTAAVLCTGDELLRGFVQDANAHYLATEFRNLGISVAAIRICSDDIADITRQLEELAALGVDLIVTSGGLGPTHDDRTAEAVAGFTDRDLALDHEALKNVEARVAVLAAARGNDPARFADGNRKQATLPEGAIALNPSGTAPGFIVVGSKQSGQAPTIVVLPGPPNELFHGWVQARDSDALRPIIEQVGDKHERLLRVWGIPESFLAELLSTLGHVDTEDVRVTLCARDGELELSVRGRDEHAIDELIESVHGRLGEQVFAVDNHEPIEQIVGALLQQHSKKLAVAESCTGGMLGARCTSVAGSSAWFVGGVISYDNEVKVSVLGVDRQDIVSSGAVSETVARQMARGVQERLSTDVGIGITGVAGPGGGTAQKPVGTVWIGVANGQEVAATKVQLVGDRETIRRRSSVIALHLIRKALQDDRA